LLEEKWVPGTGENLRAGHMSLSQDDKVMDSIYKKNVNYFHSSKSSKWYNK